MNDNHVPCYLSKCWYVLPEYHTGEPQNGGPGGGYPVNSLKEIAACRTAYRESDNQDFDSDRFRPSGLSRFGPKKAASRRRSRVPGSARICKLNQNIMTRLLATGGTGAGGLNTDGPWFGGGV